jgi:hypothetical protein
VGGKSPDLGCVVGVADLGCWGTGCFAADDGVVLGEGVALFFLFLPRAEGSVGLGDTCNTADVSLFQRLRISFFGRWVSNGDR